MVNKGLNGGGGGNGVPPPSRLPRATHTTPADGNGNDVSPQTDRPLFIKVLIFTFHTYTRFPKFILTTSFSTKKKKDKKSKLCQEPARKI